MTIKALYPTVRPTLNLNFARTKALDRRVTFTRASTATFVGSNGLIQTAASGAARFDHNPATGESLGLLVEEARTNSTRNSTDLSPSSFYTGAVGQPYTFSTNQTTSPDGTITAGSILFPGTKCGFAITSTGVTATTITVNLFAKYITGSVNTHVRIQLSPGGGGNNYGLFNLTTGAFSTSGSVSSVTMTPFPNGWYRCSVTATHSTTWPQNSGDIRIWFHGATATETPINNTDQTYVWGVQLEAGAFPTSYIPTTTATVTRAADLASITGANFSSWYRQDEGTVFCQGISNSRSNSSYWTTSNGGSNGASVLVYPNNNITYQVVNSSIQVNSTFATYSAVASVKTAAAIKLNNFAVVANGGAITSDTSGTVPAVTSFVIGNYLGGGTSFDYSGTIARLAYYPVRLPDAQLQELTK